LAKLRYLISAEDLQALLASSEIRESCWIADENQRKQRYRELINSSDRVALLQMINTLHQHKKAQAATGRKFYLCDENFLRDAEKLLNAEFSLVLGIKPSDVGAYILSVLDK
jgi:CarD family transcriptional regulator